MLAILDMGSPTMHSRHWEEHFKEVESFLELLHQLNLLNGLVDGTQSDTLAPRHV